jgi:hypothetical protein
MKAVSSNRTFIMFAGVAVWCLLVWRAIGAFGPSSAINNVDFNSDSAIPVLMSNDDRPITIFNFYYYGADRWGAWPFLATQLIRRVTGCHWTDHGVFVLQTVWIFVGALIFAGLSGTDRRVAALAYLIALCLHVESRYLLFELSQVYAWQVTALLFSWYSLRHVFDSYLLPARNDGVSQRWRWALLTASSSFLAVWSAVSSVPLLVCLLGLETLRAWLKSRAGLTVHSLLRPSAIGLIAIAAATAIELLLKAGYRRYSLEHYGDDFKTTFGLDTGYLAANLAEQLGHLARLSWWPLHLAATMALLAFAGGMLYASRSKSASRTRLSAVLADDTVILAIGAAVIAAVNFALSVVVDHVRVHGYDDRYLALTNLFSPVSGMLVLFLVLELACGSSRFRALVRPAFVAVGVALLVGGFPAGGRHDPRYQLLEETALALAHKAPRGVLLGGYWETYVFVALQPTNTMTPVVFEHHVTRTPWTREVLRQAKQVVVAFTRPAPEAEVVPPRTLRQFGRTLSLLEPSWYENRGYAFSLYANDSN